MNPDDGDGENSPFFYSFLIPICLYTNPLPRWHLHYRIKKAMLVSIMEVSPGTLGSPRHLAHTTNPANQLGISFSL